MATKPDASQRSLDRSVTNATHTTTAKLAAGDAAAPEKDGDGVEIIRTSHGVVPSQWIRRLPCPIRAVVIFAYCELLRPDDDFRQHLRKIVLLFGPLCSGASGCALIANWLLEDAWSFPSVGARFNTVSMTIIWWASYIMCRYTGEASAVIADIWVFGTWIGLLFGAVTFADWPFEQSFILVLIIAMLFRTPRLPLHAVLNLIGIALASYNNAAFARGEPDVVLMGHPEMLMRGVGVRMLFSALSYGSIVVVLAGLQLQLLESDRQTEQATANSDVAAELARHLGEYNTRQAAAVVARAEAERTADPALLQAFRVLTDNLERYRPHLPNWMLRSQDTSDGDDDERTIRADDVSTQISNRNGRPGSHFTRSTTQSEQSVMSQRSRKSEQQPAVQVGQLAPNVVQTASAVLAHVHFALRQGGAAATAKPSRQRVADATCGFADRVHQLARSTGGAVHSFVGDLVVVSWNAAARAIQPEMKAVRFLLRLREDAGDADVAVGGAAFAGQARVQLAGSAGAQAALTVHARWYGALAELAALGRGLGSFVVDAGFKAQVEYGAVVRPAAAVCVDEWRDGASHDPAALRTAPPRRVLVAHEVVSEVAEGNDEWMYVLDKAKHDDSSIAQHHNAASAVVDGAGDPDAANVSAFFQAVAGLAATVVRSVGVTPETTTRKLDRDAVVRLLGDCRSLSRVCSGWLQLPALPSPSKIGPSSMIGGATEADPQLNCPPTPTTTADRKSSAPPMLASMTLARAMAILGATATSLEHLLRAEGHS